MFLITRFIIISDGTQNYLKAITVMAANQLFNKNHRCYNHNNHNNNFIQEVSMASEIEETYLERTQKTFNYHFSEVYQIYQSLMTTVDEMDTKIQHVIRLHQQEFLFAYRNHIKKIKQELDLIRRNADEHEKKMMANEKTVLLQKQLVIFREESLKLYQNLEQKTGEAEIFAIKLKDAQKINSILEAENKSLIRREKMFQARLKLKQNRIQQLEQQILSIKQQILQQKTSKSKQTLKSVKQSKTHKKSETYQFSKNQQNQKSLKEKSVQNTIEVGNLYRKRLSSHQVFTEKQSDHELKYWFLECLNTIRRQLSQRKAYQSVNKEIYSIQSLDQFLTIDKLRLLEMFLQNQKFIVWMYQKIFPDRMSQIQDYLRSNKQPVQVNEKSASMNIFINDSNNFDISPTPSKQSVHLEVNLPSLVSELKIKNKNKFEIRKRIEIKNGQLNFSGPD